jgi:hypothetical protein
MKAVVAELPTYGYRRVHAVLERQALEPTFADLTKYNSS